MLLFSHFATHAVCSSPYLLTTLACQTCFATWQWRVVSSLDILELLIPCWLVQGQNARLEDVVCDPGVKLPNSCPAPNSAKAVLLASRWFCVTVTPVSSTMDWRIGPYELHHRFSPISELAESQTSALSDTWSLTPCVFTHGLRHWLANY